MRAHIQPNHKIDPCRTQVFEQFQITELPIQDQRLVTEQVFDRLKRLQMIQVTRVGLLGNGARRVGKEMTWQRPPAIGRRQEQEPKAFGLTILEGADIGRAIGLRAR